MGHRVVHVASGIPPARTLRYQLQRVGGRLRRPGERLRPVWDVFAANRVMRRLARRSRFDLVWVDRGLAIRPETLRELRGAQPQALFLSFSLDDMSNPQHQSRRWLGCVSGYDLHVTNKSYNVSELEEMGAPHVLFVDNAYDPQVHRPLEISEADRARYGGAIGFVGHYERERGEMILGLCREGLEVRVHGPAWKPLRGVEPRLVLGETYLDGLEYTKAINATAINLGFLRKGNRDLQTTRSIEIPACGGFLLAERTDEHRRLFQEGEEAEFFASFPELLEKCRHYLAHPDERQRLAAAGRRRCQESDYSHAAQLARVLVELEGLPRREA
jgi:hypothetical protein